MVFFTLYLQLLGMSDFAASLLMAVFLGGTAVGAHLHVLSNHIVPILAPKPRAYALKQPKHLENGSLSHISLLSARCSAFARSVVRAEGLH